MVLLFVSARKSHSRKLVMDDVVTELRVGQLQERPNHQHRQKLQRGNGPTSLRLQLSYHHFCSRSSLQVYRARISSPLSGDDGGRSEETHIPKIAALGRKCC